MNIAIAAKIVLGLIPTIADTIVSLEQIDATSGKGAAKKALALRLVQAAYEASGPAIPWTEVVNHVEKTVDALVEFYNAIGKFVKGTSAA